MWDCRKRETQKRHMQYRSNVLEMHPTHKPKSQNDTNTRNERNKRKEKQKKRRRNKKEERRRRRNRREKEEESRKKKEEEEELGPGGPSTASTLRFAAVIRH